MKSPNQSWSENPIAGLEIYVLDFKNSRLVELLDLMSAIEREDEKLILKITHIWKGVAGPYGFAKLITYSEKIEELAQSHRISECGAITKDIEVYLSSK